MVILGWWCMMKGLLSGGKDGDAGEKKREKMATIENCL